MFGMIKKFKYGMETSERRKRYYPKRTNVFVKKINLETKNSNN